MVLGKLFSAAALLALGSSVALADDWIADRLRGSVLTLNGGEWESVARGDTLADGAMIRTESDGHVDLVRGAETISLSTNTEISLRDRAGERVTNVVQWRGTVSVSAERRTVQHFSVQTPVLAAIVKGTQFSVTYSNGKASVSVQSGTVEVQDPGHDMVVEVTAGQSAEASQMRAMDVSGPGSENVVFTIEGQSVPAAARDAVVKGDLAAQDAVAAVKDGTIVEINRGNGPGRGHGGPGNSDGPRGEGRGGPGPRDNDGPRGGPGGPKGNDGPGNGPGPRGDGGGGKGPESRGNDGPKDHGGPGGGNGPGNGPAEGPRNESGPGNSGPGNSGSGPGGGHGGGPGGGGPGEGGPGGGKGPGH